MTIENNHVGIACGAGAGAYKGICIITDNLALISVELVIQAGILAFVGGALGWLGSELMSFIKRLYIKWRNKKHDEASG